LRNTGVDTHANFSIFCLKITFGSQVLDKEISAIRNEVVNNCNYTLSSMLILSIKADETKQESYLVQREAVYIGLGEPSKCLIFRAMSELLIYNHQVYLKVFAKELLK